MNNDYFSVIVLDGLRIHNIQKNAHSAINVATFSLPHRLATPQEEGNEYRFMVVRHPLDRIVDAWAFFCTRDVPRIHHDMHDLGYRLDMTFGEFLEHLLKKHDKNIHTQKQVLFTGGHKIDFLCPIHKLNDVWKDLAKKFNLNELPERYNWIERGPWEEYYTDEQRERAELEFKEDIELYQQSLENI